jgi:serine/threonine-protein phosphatase 2B catalytic subunit
VFMELFDVLPIAAFLENDIGRFLLVHGGISPELLDLSQINEIDRFVEPPGEVR